MPLYELILICKIGEASILGNMLREVTQVVLQEGGIVRTY